MKSKSPRNDGNRDTAETLQWRTEKRPVASLKDYDKNPRTLTAKRMADLKASRKSLMNLLPLTHDYTGIS